MLLSNAVSQFKHRDTDDWNTYKWLCAATGQEGRLSAAVYRDNTQDNTGDNTGDNTQDNTGDMRQHRGQHSPETTHKI